MKILSSSPANGAPAGLVLAALHAGEPAEPNGEAVCAKCASLRMQLGEHRPAVEQDGQVPVILTTGELSRIEKQHSRTVEGPAGAAAPDAPKPRAALFTVNARNCAHAIKVRHRFAVSDRLKVEVGYDEDLHGRTPHGSRPWCALQFQLDANDASQGFLEVNNDFIAVHKHWDLKLQKLTVGVEARLGMTTQGQPHAKVGVSNIPLMLAAGAVMLYLGRPVHFHKREAGGLCLDLPLPLPSGHGRRPYLLHEGLEVDCCLRRQGRGLALDVQELSGAVQLRHGKAPTKK